MEVHLSDAWFQILISILMFLIAGIAYMAWDVLKDVRSELQLITKDFEGRISHLEGFKDARLNPTPRAN